MSLVVVVADADTPVSLTSDLQSLGYEVAQADNPELACDLCLSKQPNLVVAARAMWAEEVAGCEHVVPVVAVSSQGFAREELMGMLRAGVADAWELPQALPDLGARINELFHRLDARASEADRQLQRYVTDLNRDQRAGRYIQMGMLPPNPMAIGRYRFQHRIVPSLILSGDFVDYFRITDRYYGVYVADVSGHGASSAFVTVLLKNFSRRLRREYKPAMLTDPSLILQWINAELLEQKIDKHVAMIMAIGDLQEDVVHFSNAGHFPPVIQVSGGRAKYLEQRGKPLGLFDTVSYSRATLPMEPGDRLVVFSDGVLETMRGLTLQQKEDQLLLAASQFTDMDDIWANLGMRVDQATPDDITCLMVTREP